MVTEICSSSQEAVRDIPDGAKLLVGGTVGRGLFCMCTNDSWNTADREIFVLRYFYH